MPDRAEPAAGGSRGSRGSRRRGHARTLPVRGPRVARIPAGSPFVPVWRGRGPVLGCTGRADAHRPVPARPRRPARGRAPSSRTRPTRIRSTTWTSPASSPPATASTSTSSGSSPRSAARIPADPGPADPVQRPLDAARVARPGAVHLAPRPDAAGRRRSRSRSSGRSRRRSPGRSPGTRARRASWRVGAGHPGRAAGPVARLHGPAGQLLALPAARRRRALAGGARPARATRARSSLAGPARRPRDAVAERRGAGRWRRSGSRSSGTAGGRWRLRRRPRPAGAIPLWAAAGRASRCSSLVDGAVVRPPARGLRLALAVDRVGQGAVHPRHRRVEQHHDPGDPRPPARHGHRARCC